MLNDSTFHPGDSLEILLRKVLLKLNARSPANADPAIAPAPGDFSFHTSRKILARLLVLIAATGDVTFKQGDSLYVIWRKILSVLNQAPSVPAGAGTDPCPGDLPFTTVRKILLRINALVSDVVPGVDTMVCGDSLWALWRKILGQVDRADFSETPVPPVDCGESSEVLLVALSGTPDANGVYTYGGFNTYLNNNYIIVRLYGVGGMEAALYYGVDLTLMYSLPEGESFPCGTWVKNNGDNPVPSVSYLYP
jgi:hypothetical protein